MRRKFNLVTVFFVLLTFFAGAQETTSEIQGLVTDSKGTPLPGATIVAIHTPTGTQYATTSRKDGRYNLANLRIGGPYTITETFVGSKEQKLDNITLSLGQVYKADFSAETAMSQLSEVVVSATRQNKIFNNGRTGQQEIVNRTQIERLPTINRSFQDFSKLEPTANGLNFGGRSSQYNNLTVDGANFNNSFGLSGTLGGQTGSQPISLDAIEQLQVNVSPYDVRQGGFSGAGLNAVTRSGTNQFKGSIYTYTKNENYQGYKVANATVPKTPIDFNLRGFSLGGAIIKNKLFFFVSGEQVRQELPATSYIASDASHPVTSGSVSIANADTLKQLSDFLQSNYNYNTGAFQGYNLKTQSDKITARIDWNINDRNTLTLKYNYLKSSADQLPSTSRNGYSGFVGGQSPGNFAMPFQNSGYVINNDFNIVIAELNTRLSNKAVNKFQVGFTQLRDYRTPQGNSNMPLVDILLNGNVYTTFGYEPFTYNNKLNTNVFQFSDIFTFYNGSHEITVGTQNYFRKYLNGFAPAYQGLYQFSSLSDFYNNAPATRYALQYSALKDGSFPYAEAGVTELGLFAQDKWRASNNFTLTYGLRVDYSTYTGEFDQNPDFAALTFANGAKYDVGKKPKNRPLLSPRLGFNWDALGDKSLQVRGGAGIFSGPPPFVWISNQASNNGVQFGSIIYSGATAKTFNPNPDTYRPDAGAPNTAYGIAVSDDNFKYPSVLKTGLAFDKKLKNNVVLTLEGTYTKDINAVYYSNINLNQSSANAITLGGPDPRVRYAAVAGSSNKIYSGAGGASAANPNISTAILMKNTKKGYSYTTTARAQKTFKDLYLSVAYTYSKSQNTAESGSTAGGLWSSRPIQNDPNTANLANAAWYLPHRVIAFASYKISYAKYFSTSIGLVYEAAPNGVTSYVYNGDLNNDGNTGNDLIYIPRSSSEINLVKSGSGGLGTGTGTPTSPVTDARTTAQIWAQLNNFINQDRYLSSHRGKVAEANAVILPFFKKLDLNITQDISAKVGSERHTLRFSLDILNFGNLLNKEWGIIKTPGSSNFLRYEGLGSDGKTPSYSFTYQDANNQVPLVNSFSNNTSILSRWQMQLGFRYLFN
ncbi:MAG: carboxypeptidase regulatory-like domain-containing protein [Ferruginibacter sp.]